MLFNLPPAPASVTWRTERVSLGRLLRSQPMGNENLRPREMKSLLSMGICLWFLCGCLGVLPRQDHLLWWKSSCQCCLALQFLLVEDGKSQAGRAKGPFPWPLIVNTALNLSPCQWSLLTLYCQKNFHFIRRMGSSGYLLLLVCMSRNLVYATFFCWVRWWKRASYLTVFLLGS